jgi:hypothetical protein
VSSVPDIKEGLSRLSAARQSLGGGAAAVEYPWWRTGMAFLPVAAVVTELQHVDAPQGSLEAAFKNTTPHDVLIDKLVFTAPIWGEYKELMNTLVQITTDEYQVIKLWLPVTTLHTEEDRYIYGAQHGQTFRLPAPYSLTAPSILRLRIQNMTNLSGFDTGVVGVHLIVTLQGYNPIDRDPIVMAKRLVLPAFGAYAYLSFDENRDGSLRDMVIEKITFAVDDYFMSDGVLPPPQGPSGAMFSFWSGLGIRFDTPEGPEWSNDSNSPLFSLFEQFQVYDPSAASPEQGYYPVAYHRPITPYVLKPMQSLHIKVLNYTGHHPVVTVLAIGRQKGGRV